MESCVNGADGRLEVDLSSQPSILEEKEHLQVFLRVRPFTSAESLDGESQDCVSIEAPDTVVLKPPSWSPTARLSVSLPQTVQRFQFSQVYGPGTSQRELFEGTVRDLIKDVLEGGNSLLFTYGVTNAGKTFTFLGPEADAGILPRSLNVIFSSMEERVFTGTRFKPQRCREFTRLSAEQQKQEEAFKRNFFRQLKESERSNASLLPHDNSRTLLEGSSLLGTSLAEEDRILLEVEAHTKFSVWVSFCEIYNENIHDLLEAAPSGAPRRPVLRLSQDVKGNAFVKDLRWVQVSSAEEAYKVMKLGKKNQSFSSTRLNQLSSRSHSIFSIRILRIEDTGTPRVLSVSELCLCDLAGSERCAKTQNQGERLKEAGNINASLLILGKCINALRHNQQARLLQHVPFRESKLTHYLQGFFCGRGKASMVVNINQCASMYDETLNVLKFSAVAQKVVVVSTRPLPPTKPNGSTDEAERRRSSLIGWETSLEDVQEDKDDEEEEEETSLMDQTGRGEEVLISKRTYQQLQMQLEKERADSLLLEARVREELSREFSDMFSDMQNDYKDRLCREREILEERAERRMEIFKNLIYKMTRAGSSQEATHTEKALDSSELEGLKEACGRLVPGQEASWREGRDAVEELERTMLQLQERSLQHRDDAGEEDQPEKQVEDPQRSPGGDLLQEVKAALEEERKAKQEVLTALEFQTVGKEEALASLEEERRSREEAGCALETERKEVSRLLEEGGYRKQQLEALQQEVAEVKVKLEQVRSEAVRAAQSAGERLEEQSKEIQEKTSQIHVLMGGAAGAQKLTEEKREEELQEMIEKLKIQHQASTQELREELQEQENRERASREEVEELRGKLEEQTRTSKAEKLREEQKRREEEKRSEEVMEDLKQKLEKQTWASEKEVEVLKEEQKRREEDLKQKLREQQKSSELLTAELEEAQTRGSSSEELQSVLLQKEAQLAALQRSLQEAQEHREQEEIQAGQEARRREAERRRELLGVAHEAIAQKEEELETRAQEISRLKESSQRDSEKLQSFGAELRRKEDEASDLREKLADYRKQVQQVQREICTMREEEKVSRQKLSDLEKSRKQLQSDLGLRDRTIAQLRAEKSAESKSDQALQLYNQSCKDLEVKERVMEDMRLALTEQEETQAQMEEVLEDKLNLIQELSHEVDRLKATLLEQVGEGAPRRHEEDGESRDLRRAKQEAAQAQESSKLCADKHQTERRKWLEEKLSLIGQAKEAEHKRNQEMRKFAEDRERHARQQSLVENLNSQLEEKERSLEAWRKERDALVSALEVQLQKLLSSQAHKDQLIQELRRTTPNPPPESGGDGGVEEAELRAALRQREADVLRLEEELKARQTQITQSPAQPEGLAVNRKSAGRRDTTASVSSQGSAGCPSVLDSSQISTENGRMSRFPRPELEISFSPLQPNRVNLRRQGQDVTLKISRPARKRKSGEMDKSHIFRRSKRRPAREEEVENRRNTRTRATPRLTPHQEEGSSPAGRHDTRSRKEVTLQKIGDFLQSSPTLLGSKAKKMMSLVSGRSEAESSSSSSSPRDKKSKRKLYRPHISSPMDVPSHPIVVREPEEREGDHRIIKRRLRSRTGK